MKELFKMLLGCALLLLLVKIIRLFSDKDFRFPNVFAAFPDNKEAALADGVFEGTEALGVREEPGDSINREVYLPLEISMN
ncbi:hypothetical protein AMJ48_03165 [Parcubacteria bacterium DG_74_1]|nr:MAG: hypothetical protein AMJ48_03165 [Parcubacteria bacterium DG_74_1]